MLTLLNDVLQFAHYALTFILIVIAAICVPASVLVIIALFPRRSRERWYCRMCMTWNTLPHTHTVGDHQHTFTKEDVQWR